MMNKRSIGKVYEALALDYLEANKFGLITKNYFCPYGEIDLVVCKDDVIYFIEVKYRSNLSFGSPRDAINHQKIQRMKKTALYYLKAECLEFKHFNISFLGILKSGDQHEYDFIENIFS